MRAYLMKKTASLGPEPAEDPHLELMRAVRFCHPGWDSSKRITLRDADRAAWQTEVFLPVLRPQLEAAWHAAAAADWRGLMACDLALDQALPAGAVSGSRLAGAALLRDYPAPPGERLWTRYAALVADGKSSGHLGMALAVRAAAFHFSPAAMVAAYVFLEARGGLSGRSMISWMEIVEQCVPGDGTAVAPQIRVA